MSESLVAETEQSCTGESDFRLIVPDTEFVDAIVPVRWCISPKLERQMLSDIQYYRDFLVCISIIRRDPEDETKVLDERRLVLPLKQALETIEFQRNGSFELNAVLMRGGEKATLRGMRKWFCARSSPKEYEHTLYNSETGEFKEGFVYGDANHSSITNTTFSVKIQVSTKFFAKEPAPWRRWYADWLHEFPSENSCQFRKRFWILGLLKFPCFVASAVGWVALAAVLTITFCGLCGFRFKSWKGFIPFTNMDQLLDPTRENNYILTDKDGEERSNWFALAIPGVILAIVGIIGYFFTLLVTRGGWRWILPVVFALVLGSVLSYGAKLLHGKWIIADRERRELKAEYKKQAQSEKERIKREVAQERFRRECEGVVCTSTPMLPSVSALPQSKQTIRLRVQELKASGICRPFAKM